MPKTYGQKRNFQVTPEPAWSKEKGTPSAPLTFVVHKHESRRLHFDLRLENDGVLKSWAVPKGISLDPADKHLAVMVEDHPFDYGSFEGVIPEGQYGAGKVTIWDKGTYSPEHEGKHYFDDREAAEKLVREGISKGELKVFFRGNILKGSFVLIRLKTTEKNWLIIKHRDEYSDGPTATQNEDIKSTDPPKETATPTIRPDSIIEPPSLPGIKKAKFPERLSPMLAFPTAKPFSSPEWFFEPKLDGYRTLAFVWHGKVTLYSRNGIDSTARFSAIARNAALNIPHEVLFDGEIVALDEKGRPCFQCLQDQIKAFSSKNPESMRILYYVFDVLYLDGYDLSGVPLEERKRVIAGFVPASGIVRRIDYFEKDGELIYKTAIEQGFEGVVAKRRDSLYEAGRRSKNWLKIKAVQTDDFVVGGYEIGQGARGSSIGSLLLGDYEDNKLVYTGQVGTGFDEKTLLDIKARLDRIKSDASPFEVHPKFAGQITWVRPEIVVEVKYAERTNDGRLRAPVFLRLREDKNAAETELQTPVVVATTGDASDPDADDSVVSKLEQASDDVTLTFHGEKLKITHLEKEYWPANSELRAVTKRDMLIYLAKVSSYILPHLHDRPITLNRFPEGVEGEHFYQRHWHTKLPDFVRTVELPEEGTGEGGPYILCQNLPSLLWLGQSGNLEFHAWFSRAIAPDDTELEAGKADNIADLPDFIIFDLDPYIYSGKEPKGAEPELSRAGFSKTVQAAKWLRATLEKLSLPAYVKTSGKTGIHVYVPVVRKYGYDAVRALAESVASHLVREHQDDLTEEWLVAKRTGKVFIDYKQNTYTRTLASVYSPRASQNATVSMALPWEKLESVYPTDFTVLNAASYIAEHGDPWSDMMSHKANLDSVLKM